MKTYMKEVKEKSRRELIQAYLDLEDRKDKLETDRDAMLKTLKVTLDAIRHNGGVPENMIENVIHQTESGA